MEAKIAIQVGINWHQLKHIAMGHVIDANTWMGQVLLHCVILEWYLKTLMEVSDHSE